MNNGGIKRGEREGIAPLRELKGRLYLVIAVRALAEDMKKTVDKYFGEIVKATLPALGQQKWRERQAACEALNDILSIGRKADEVLPFLNELWSSAMKVGDDIKESVALSGMKLIKSLACA